MTSTLMDADGKDSLTLPYETQRRQLKPKTSTLNFFLLKNQKSKTPASTQQTRDLPRVLLGYTVLLQNPLHDAQSSSWSHLAPVLFLLGVFQSSAGLCLWNGPRAVCSNHRWSWTLIWLVYMSLRLLHRFVFKVPARTGGGGFAALGSRVISALFETTLSTLAWNIFCSGFFVLIFFIAAEESLPTWELIQDRNYFHQNS